MHISIKEGFNELQRYEFPITLKDTAELLDVSSIELNSVLHELGIKPEKSGVSNNITESIFNNLILFKRLKTIIKEKKSETKAKIMINVAATHLLKRLRSDYMDRETGTFSDELTIEVIHNLVSSIFEG